MKKYIVVLPEECASRVRDYGNNPTLLYATCTLHVLACFTMERGIGNTQFLANTVRVFWSHMLNKYLYSIWAPSNNPFYAAGICSEIAPHKPTIRHILAYAKAPHWLSKDTA